MTFEKKSPERETALLKKGKGVSLYVRLYHADICFESKATSPLQV